VELPELATRLGVTDRHHRLFRRALEILAEEGDLNENQSGWSVVAPLRFEDPESTLASLLAQHPAFSAELSLAAHCGRALADVFRGAVDPLTVLFPDGSSALLERVYQESPFARMTNALAAESIVRAIESLPHDRIVRILEVGAGTGGTTSSVLPRLDADRAVYVFTDLSRLFTTQAREKFSAFPFVHFDRLDIERDPAESGFDAHQYDVVLAANVLHATANLRQSLRNARRLLAADGLLVLIEGTGPQRLLDLVFGLTEGWWRFADHDLRPRYPLIGRERWAELLRAESFADVAFLPSRCGEKERSRQAVILARGPAVVEVELPPRPREAAGSIQAPIKAQDRETISRALLQGVDAERRRPLIESYLQAALGRLLGLPVSVVALDRPVTSFGLDSLMAIQLKNRIESALGVSLSIVTMLEGLSVAQIARRIHDDLFHEEMSVVTPPPVYRNGKAHANGAELANGGSVRPARRGLDRMLDDLDDLSESELDTLIDDLTGFGEENDEPGPDDSG
jgi:SAM-dependent methyltransferase/acyl carrier protein